MENRSFLKHLPFIALATLPILFLVFYWNKIPTSVPTHFDAHMQPNNYSTRVEFFLVELFISALSVGVYFLLININKIDPKRAGMKQPGTFGKIASVIVLFLTAIQFITIRMGLTEGSKNGALLVAVMGLFFAFLGNVMHSIKPNYFVGLRLPWTLSSDDNWRATHRLAGKLWFAGGLLISVLSFFGTLEFALRVMFAVMAVVVIIPIVYSFIYYKKEQRPENGQ